MASADSAVIRGSASAHGRTAEERARLEALARDCFQFIWRSLRRLGVPEAMVDDATPRVFEGATQKLHAGRPGAERAFLFGTALRVASSTRRHVATRRETPDEALENRADAAPRPDEATELKRQRQGVDEALDSTPSGVGAG